VSVVAYAEAAWALSDKRSAKKTNPKNPSFFNMANNKVISLRGSFPLTRAGMRKCHLELHPKSLGLAK